MQSYIPTERGYEIESVVHKAPLEKDILQIEESKQEILKSPEIIMGEDEYDPFSRKSEYNLERIVDENDENKEAIEYDPMSVKPLYDENEPDVEPDMEGEEGKGQEFDDIVQKLNNGFLFCQRFKLPIGKLQKKQTKKYFENFLRV